MLDTGVRPLVVRDLSESIGCIVGGGGGPLSELIGVCAPRRVRDLSESTGVLCCRVGGLGG